MFSLVAISLCAVDITATHLLGLKHSEYGIVFQVYIALLCLLGALSKGGPRDRSVLSVFAVWAFLVVATDQFNLDLPNILTAYEAFVFTSLVMLTLFRPYFFASDARSKRNVCVCFYKGTRGPILSTISALVGLPFSSVAIVAGDKAIRPSMSGKMVLTDVGALYASKDFVSIDTGMEITNEFLDAMETCVGKPTKSLGIFRTKCVSNIRPLLCMIGYDPKFNIPSIFYYQCIRQAHG